MAVFNRNGVQVGVLVAVGNLLIYQHFMPPVADVKAGDQHDNMIDKTELEALAIATAFTVVVSGAVRSFDTFLVGGIVVVALSYAYKHANATHPDTGTMQPPGGQQLGDGTDSYATVHPMPEYAGDDAGIG
jgi:hypothetical protein